MANYKVIKPFFKLSEKKEYKIDDTIQLSKEEVKNLDLYVVEIKETKTKKTDD